MNKDQWKQKKPASQAAPAERALSAASRPAGRRIVPPAREVIVALKRAAAADHAGDLSWNPWQP